MKRRNFFSIPLAISLLFAGPACNTSQPVENIGAAKFIFRGTIEQLQAATLPEISNTEDCIVVKVTEVLEAPVDFADWTNRSITVLAKAPEKLKIGAEQVFYTRGWLYGQGLAVIEVASRRSTGTDKAQVQKEVNQYRDQLVRERLNRSPLVVAGEVTEIKALDEKSSRESEHDPLWQEATIKIQTLVKGSWNEDSVRFRFPGSRDVMWQDAPRFSVGQTGVWLLRPATQNDNYFEITEAEDYYALERLEYLQSLLK